MYKKTYVVCALPKDGDPGKMFVDGMEDHQVRIVVDTRFGMTPVLSVDGEEVTNPWIATLVDDDGAMVTLRGNGVLSNKGAGRRGR